MSLAERFEDAQKRVKTLPKVPGNNDLLQLYAHYKQGSVGDVTGKRPGMLDVRARAKFDAWKKLAGTSREQAQEDYITTVDRLLAAAGR